MAKDIRNSIQYVSHPGRNRSSKHGSKSILLMYSDGNPDHRSTYMLVQLSLIVLFINLDLAMLTCRTAPINSRNNPVERIMSIVNLGLQCLG